MTSETSKMSYAEMRDQIPESKARIIAFMTERERADWTVRELSASMFVDSRSIAPRVHELEKEGSLFIAKNRMCGITLRTVHAYSLAPEIILSAREAMS